MIEERAVFINGEWVTLYIDDFTRGYLDAVEWLWPEEWEGEEHPTYFDDMPPEVLREIVEECRIFQTMNVDDLEAFMDAYGAEHAGHDYFLTRNGHGAGFWDKKGPDPEWDAICDRLSDAARADGETDYEYR